MPDPTEVYRRRLVRRAAGILVLGVTLPMLVSALASGADVPLLKVIIEQRARNEDLVFNAANWARFIGGVVLGLLMLFPIGPPAPRARPT